MPRKPLRPCRAPGCPKPATVGSRCRQHARALRREYDNDRPSAAQRGYDPKWRRIRAQYLRHHPLCQATDEAALRFHARFGDAATDVDHIVPVAQGGTNRWVNLQALCHRCHSAKTMRESVRVRASKSLGQSA